MTAGVLFEIDSGLLPGAFSSRVTGLAVSGNISPRGTNQHQPFHFRRLQSQREYLLVTRGHYGSLPNRAIVYTGRKQIVVLILRLRI